MTDSVAVRSARPEDAPLIAGFQLLMARETEGVELDPETVRRGVGAVFADPARGEYFVADAGGWIVGCLLVTREWSDWRDGAILWIASLYVVPEMRGRGVYRALYEHLQERVRDSPDLMGIRLYVDKRNTAAQRVYTRLGMTREHYELFEWMKR